MWRQQALLPVFWLGCGHQWPEVDVAGDGLYSGQFGRRDGIRQARNRAGRPAVCSRLPRTGAFRRHPCLNAFLSLCQPTLCCACLLLWCRCRRFTGAFWPAQKLCVQRPEGMTKRGGCLRDCFTRVLACAAFQTRILAGRRSGALICCFSAAVSPQVMRWLSGLAKSCGYGWPKV